MKYTIGVTLVLIALGWATLSGNVYSDSPGEEFFEIAPQGFGDPYNNGSWSMQWWNGHLYVGTVRSFFCWSQAGLNNTIPFFPYPPNDPEYDCTPVVQDLPLQAEIWRYSFDTLAWERMYQSPAIVPDPTEPGNFLARDVGFRDMTVVTESDGTEALYVGSVFPHVLAPDDPPPPRILRTTDGVNWEALPQEPGTSMGEIPVPSISRLTANGNRLFAIFGTIQGDGTVMMSEEPTAGNDSFVPISPLGTSIFEMHFYNGYLYLGTNTELPIEVASVYLPFVASDASGTNNGPPPEVIPYDLREVLKPQESQAARVGYSVLKADVSGDPPYQFVEVVTNGADLEQRPSRSVVSMEEHDGRLYVGTDAPAELIRINPDDSWDLIVGKTRVYPDGTIKEPLSGLDEGFGWFLNVHMWRMQSHQGKLYVGTADQGTRLRNFSWVPPSWHDEFGFDLWVTTDGETFTPITKNGFGDIYQMGVRTFSQTPTGLAMGSVNLWDGLRIYFNPDDASNALPSPTYLSSEAHEGDVLLSWAPVEGATSYQVYRARFAPNSAVGLEEVAAETYVPLSGFEPLASTDAFYLVDDAIDPEERYLYYIVAQDQSGATSAPSTVVQAPSVIAPMTVDRTKATLLEWSLPSAGAEAVQQGIVAPLTDIQALLQAQEVAGARAKLTQFAGILQTSGLLPEWRLEDVNALISQLDHRLRLVEANVLSTGDVD